MKTAAPERVDLPVSGMTCAACARAIERALAATPGVERARVNLATNTATVEFDPERARPGISSAPSKTSGMVCRKTPRRRRSSQAIYGASLRRPCSPLRCWRWEWPTGSRGSS